MPQLCFVPAVWLLNLLTCAWIWLATVEGKDNSYLVSAGKAKAACVQSTLVVLSKPSVMQNFVHKLHQPENPLC